MPSECVALMSRSICETHLSVSRTSNRAINNCASVNQFYLNPLLKNCTHKHTHVELPADPVRGQRCLKCNLFGGPQPEDGNLFVGLSVSLALINLSHDLHGKTINQRYVVAAIAISQSWDAARHLNSVSTGARQPIQLDIPFHSSHPTIHPSHFSQLQSQSSSMLHIINDSDWVWPKLHPLGFKLPPAKPELSSQANCYEPTCPLVRLPSWALMNCFA